MVPVYALLLFGGNIVVKHEQGLLQLDGWTLKAPARIAVLVRRLWACGSCFGRAVLLKIALVTLCTVLLCVPGHARPRRMPSVRGATGSALCCLGALPLDNAPFSVWCAFP